MTKEDVLVYLKFRLENSNTISNRDVQFMQSYVRRKGDNIDPQITLVVMKMKGIKMIDKMLGNLIQEFNIIAIYDKDNNLLAFK